MTRQRGELSFRPAHPLLRGGFWRGYAQFQRLEDYDSAARELSLPASLEAVLAWPLATASARFRGPFASLLKKEFRLQQVSFLLTGVFLLIAVVGFCLIPIYLPAAQGTVGGDCALFMLLLPLVAGAIAVAEEKGWDLAEWHLTLPPSARRQWLAKMLATLTDQPGSGTTAARQRVAGRQRTVRAARFQSIPAADLCPRRLGARPIIGDQRGRLHCLVL